MTGEAEPAKGRPRVLVIAPPFFSHAKPSATLGAAISAAGARVTFACIPELDHLTVGTQLEFVGFDGTTNRNIGRASTTEQPAEDRDRLRAFLAATRQSAPAALISQARSRRDDMLPDPDRILAAVTDVCEVVQPDWCLIDQLGYPVTLALHRLGIPFASFVVGHPTDLPLGDHSLFGVPDRWPDEIHVDESELAVLVDAARDVDRIFTGLFNAAVGAADGSPAFASAFAFSSGCARVFNYPESVSAYPRRPDRDIFMGHCTPGREVLAARWREDLDRLPGRPRVLISFGTFQWVHTDIMRRVQQGIRHAFSEAAFFIAAGDRVAELADIADDRTLIHDFLPQSALLRHVDLIVHHGGNNSFTEAAAAGVPSIVLPFAADQFAVARDISDRALGRVLDPNHFTVAGVAEAARTALTGDSLERVAALAEELAGRGPDWAARRLLTLMTPAGSGGSDLDGSHS